MSTEKKSEPKPKKVSAQKSVASSKTSASSPTPPLPAAVSDNRIAKADPNLFARPWVALWRGEARSSVINLEWEEDHPTIKGRKIKASWKVTGDAELGLPTPSDRRLFNVLCELTREQNLTQVINFTRYDVLQRLGRGSGKRNYDLLLQSFERLKAVKITARNVFRDARTGLIEDAVFSIIDDVTIVKPSKSGPIGPDELPLSTFSWSDRIHNNIENGFLLSFDLNIAQSLHSDVALILYPLLLAKTYDGPGRRRNRFHSELRDFYENHLGMRRTPYVSKMEERLLPGHEELKQIGFLVDARIEPMKTKGQFKITYVLKLPEEAAIPAEIEVLDALSNPQTPAEAIAPNSELTALTQRMMAVGVEESIAVQIEQQFAAEQINLQLDCLAARNPRDPAALFLYALRRNVAPPAAYLERVEQQRQAEEQRASSDEERQAAARRTQRAHAAREAARRQIGTVSAFYEALSDRAKAVVRQRVDVELGQFGSRGRLLYPHPDWIQILGGLLREENWVATLQELQDDWQEELPFDEQGDENETEPFQSRRLELYVETLRGLVKSGQATLQELDLLHEKSFPLLDAREWGNVKQQLLSEIG